MREFVSGEFRFKAPPPSIRSVSIGYSNHVSQGRVRRSCAASFVRRTSSCLAVFFSALSNFGIIKFFFV